MALAGCDGWSGLAADRPALPISGARQYRGISLQLHNGDPDHPFEQYVREIAATGANTVCFSFAARQENTRSTSIFIDLRKVPSDARMAGLIRLARSEGLRVVLMPIILLDRPTSDEWRGKLKPKDGKGWDAWWQEYGEYILHYARMAEATGADALVVGSELLSTEGQTGRWRALIAEVRKVYRGQLSYSANWDHYDAVKFWSDLDLIGMTTYYDLTGGRPATLERLEASWRRIRKAVLDWRAKKYPSKPLLFTEVGWPNQRTAAQYPWNYYRSAHRPDPLQQANCFEAFFRTWIAEPAAGGFLVWEWHNSPNHGSLSPRRDTSYVPKGKPAMDVIRKFYQYPEPPRPPAPKSANGSR